MRGDPLSRDGRTDRLRDLGHLLRIRPEDHGDAGQVIVFEDLTTFAKVVHDMKVGARPDEAWYRIEPNNFGLRELCALTEATRGGNK